MILSQHRQTIAQDLRRLADSMLKGDTVEKLCKMLSEQDARDMLFFEEFFARHPEATTSRVETTVDAAGNVTHRQLAPTESVENPARPAP